MKEILKLVLESLKKVFWIPIIETELLLDGLAYLILAFQLWCLNLTIYFAVIIVACIICILTGKWDLHLWEFTRSYFYDGIFIEFTAWRVHLLLYIFCLLLTFRFAE